MKALGILLALLGWIVPMVGLTMTQSTGARMGLCVVGIVVCMVAILGILNKAFQKNAIWKH